MSFFSANFNQPESCQSGSTASINVFNDSSVVKANFQVDEYKDDLKPGQKNIFFALLAK